MVGAFGVLCALGLVERIARAEPGLDAPLSDADLAALASAEAIEIFDERPAKPFDRDTDVRLTGAQLAARGATDLGTALALLPDVTVRDAGRGGVNVDIRGGRKGAVSILIDGVLVTDPYYGTFDVSTLPITDIVQIRIATTPQSPIDGPGGSGGVIEVITSDAIGEQGGTVRLITDAAPALGLTTTARVPLARHLALRLSGAGLVGRRDLPLPGAATLDEGRRAATGAARLEYRRGDRRLVVDGFVDDRSYLAPPSDEVRSNVLLVDGETTARASAKADDRWGGVQVQGHYFVHYLTRRSRSYADASLASELATEDLAAIRSGGGLLATRAFHRDFRWAASATVVRDKALVFDIGSRWSRGATTLLTAAIDGQYERARLRVDAAAGLAVPFGVDAAPWPEAKLVGRFRARPDLELTATTGYKGRLPSLRERFDRDTGNPALAPEKALHGEVRAIGTRGDARFELAPFVRNVTGMIRSSPVPDAMGDLINLGSLVLHGVDVQGRGRVHRRVELGGAYSYIDAWTSTSAQPLDRLPHHRAELWTRASLPRAISVLVRLRGVSGAEDRGAAIDGYALVEGAISAPLGGYQAVLRVDDALDRRPETRTGYHGPGRLFTLVLQGTWR